MSEQSTRDPREVLAREKYFSLRPQPLEQWIWRQSLPPSAERVFWLHWQEGMRNGNWCSELPLKRVAALCALDLSSVTRAYQVLTRTGLIRRQDPGRDPSRPFEQAVAITEVRVPREFLQELDRHPNRHRVAPPEARASVEAAAFPATTATAMADTAATPVPAPTPALAPSNPAPASAPAPADPFAGLSGRERLRALHTLRDRLSANERRQYDEALRTHQTHLAFDADSRLTAEERGRVLQLLAILAPRPLPAVAAAVSRSAVPEPARPRQLSVFELARLRRELHALVGLEQSAELLRQVVWSVEQGALRRFTSLHALRIALKKIREGAWTRPHRMPPNWCRELSPAPLRAPARAGTCRNA